jgi:cytochrome c oxidase cbb3-type subunit IV
MSSGTLSGIATGVLILIFVGVWIWAYGKHRKSSFDAAARLPLEDEEHKR